MNADADLVTILKKYNPEIPVFPFTVPDDVDVSISCAYQRIGNRSQSQYYNKEQQVEQVLFYVTFICKDYDLLTSDSTFISFINKYCEDHVLDMNIQDTKDDLNSLGYYERQYSIVMTCLRQQ
ncbi:hypothetical protein D3C84_966190 [compost metagenome]